MKEWGQDLAGSNVSCGFCRASSERAPFFHSLEVAAGRHQATAGLQIVFAHLDDRFADVERFAPEQLLNILRCYRMYEVGRKADGTPVEVPPYLAGAENAFFDEDQPSFASN